MTRGAERAPVRGVLAAFVAELARVRELCGSPSLNDLVAHSAARPHPLARSTISDKLAAKSLPDWDFVAAFVTACHTFADKTGLAPPPDAVDLAGWDARHLDLLRQLDIGRRDERLQAAAGAALRSREATPVPRQLPAAVATFAGRTGQLRRLTGWADEADHAGTVVIAVIHGTAGVGKTTLAVQAAHQLADRFPDGQLYVNLRGFDPGGQVVTSADAILGFLEALSVPPERLPASPAAQVNLYRSLLADRRVLVLLDNARDADQIRPLVPGTARSLVLVTSRDRLTSLAARDGAQPLLLAPPTDAEAVELLAARIGRARVAADTGAVGEIIASCARLPLALSVVAARAATNPSSSLTALAQELRTTPDALDVLDTADPSTGIRPTLSWSYQLLTDESARLFRLLSLHPGPDVGLTAVAGLAGVPRRRARAALRELADAHLIEEDRPGRYRFHDLLRAYAGELCDEVDSAALRQAATRRMYDYYVHAARAAAWVVEPAREPVALRPAAPGVAIDAFPELADALAWFTAERRVLLGLVDRAADDDGHAYAWQLAWSLTDFLNRNGHWQDWARSQQSALVAARRRGDQPALAMTHRNLGFAHIRLEHHEEAVYHCRRALTLHRELGDRYGQANAHLNLGGIALIYADRCTDVAHRRARQRAALRHAERAVDLFHATGDRGNEARALNSLGWAHTQLGDHHRGIEICERAAALLETEDGGRNGLAHTFDSLGYAHRQLGEHAQAVSCYRRALDLLAAMGDRNGQAETLTSLGDTHRDAGDTDAARAAWSAALAILVDIGHPSAENVAARLAGAR